MYLLLIQPNTFILGDLCTRVLHSLALICTCSHLEFERMSIFLVFSFITVSYLYLLLFISCFLVPMASLFRFYSFFGWCVCVCVLVTQSCPTLCNPMDYSQLGSSGPGILQARILVSCHFLLQEIFPTQGPNLGLLHYRQILYRQSHQRITFSDFPGRCVGDTFFELLHVCKYFLYSCIFFILLLFVTRLFRIQSWNNFEGFLSYVLLLKDLVPSLSFVRDCVFSL